MHNTLTRVEADITSLLGIKTTTELCRQNCRWRCNIIQASSHNQVGTDIYTRGVGGRRRHYGMVILCSASAVNYRVAVIRINAI